MQLSKCCHTKTLEKVADVYKSNADEFILYRCSECQEHWLYRHLEEGWMNNLTLDENEYEAWYIGIPKEYLNYVYSMEFEKILMHHGYVHISTVDEAECKSRWQQIYDAKKHAI